MGYLVFRRLRFMLFLLQLLWVHSTMGLDGKYCFLLSNFILSADGFRDGCMLKWYAIWIERRNELVLFCAILLSCRLCFDFDSDVDWLCL